MDKIYKELIKDIEKLDLNSLILLKKSLFVSLYMLNRSEKIILGFMEVIHNEIEHSRKKNKKENVKNE